MSEETYNGKDEAKPSPSGSKPEAEESDSNAASSTMSVETLRKYLSDKLGIVDKDEEKVKVLDEVSLDGIVDYIKKNNCKNIITMAGAGISTSAGIPDFRSPGSGLYHNLQKYNLPHPQAIFELDFFHENPKPFFELAKELYPGSFHPTICHYFIRQLCEKNLLLRHYSQNIDTLERVAGIPETKIVEAHGTFYTGHCLKCRKEYSLEWMKERIFKDEVPQCEARNCSGVVKPDIVFFGEALPHKFYTSVETDFKKCDLLIILGSSLAVQPFASLIDRVPDGCPRLLINREKVGHKSGIMAMLGLGGGLDFDGKNNTRDVAWLGDCDEGCYLLAEKLGWGVSIS
ncbi:SIR2 domain containing protein [Asbolus verrucosus]|uniref:NAD-dependent protein deacetylase n=1 Tax=Asbolus verrucosus TaxID=1661398 RepID=A0A482W5Z1_ASBVE|nr:SIR2 domain containing protein [Asbolus verrucosus]